MRQRPHLTDSLSPLQWGFVAIAVLTVLRLGVLAANQFQLYPDESQYWVWSREFDWGYFSKPPLIAWMIGLSTSLLGDSDFAVRLPALLFHAMGAVFLLLTAHRVRPGWPALWVPVLYLTLPGIAIGSMIISTDSLLLPLWAGALYFLIRMRSGDTGWAVAIGLGLFTGLAFLAKYAAIYFLIGTGLAILLDRDTRTALLSLKGLAAGLILMAVWSPNLVWNAAHDFATVQHTAANANWQGNLFNVLDMIEFLAGQFGVFGLLLLPVLFLAAVQAWRHWRDPGFALDRFLTLYSVPALLVVTAQAFISRAHANWAASAYVAGTLLVFLFLMRGRSWRRGIMAISIALGAGFALVVSTVAINPSLTGELEAARGIRHLRGWPETAAAIHAAEQQGEYTALVFDDRNVFHQMQRYGGAIETPLRMWQRYGAPHNHADTNWPLADGTPGPVLIVAEREWERARLLADFGQVRLVAELSIATDGYPPRRLSLYEARDYQRLERTEAYEAEPFVPPTTADN